jgi:hypothetical protein
VELFRPVVESLDALHRAANADDNDVVFYQDFPVLIRAVMDTLTEFNNQLNAFILNSAREGMSIPSAGGFLDNYVNFILREALALCISYLIFRRITPPLSPASSSTGSASSHSSAGGDGFGPMGS